MGESFANRLAVLGRPDLPSLQGVLPAAAEGLVRLDLMENPYALPAPLQQALGERLGRVALHRYPGAEIDRLRDRLARESGMPEGCALLLGNGSDELITLLCMACHRDGAEVLAPAPSFLMYALAARRLGMPFTGVPLTPAFELDREAMLQAMAGRRPAVVFLACPNNPTGTLWDDDAIEAVIHAAPGLVVLDEAYQPFSRGDSMHRLARHPHVLVLRTLSKFGLAGARVGYLMGRSELILEIDKFRSPFNVSALDAEAALFALDHLEEYRRQAACIRAERERLQLALAALAGVQPFPSEANMILVRVADAGRVCSGLRSAGILVRDVSATHPLLHGCLRVTVGTPDENTQLLRALDAVL
jgi:histidinol-phosphate aminotransferase